jgi:25S rRNA (cytosine2870-C5)-methyltransferase
MKMSRADLVKQMTQDVSIYYGYSLELAEYFMQLLNPSECLAFFEAVETSRPVTCK